MELVLIAAVSKNNVIGVDGDLPEWDKNIRKNDLKRFKELTLNHPVIIGRKTYQSLPEKNRPLIDRLNYVLSKNHNFKLNEEEEAYKIDSLDHALWCISKQMPKKDNIDYRTAYIVGGGEIYRESISLVDRLEITHIDRSIYGDKKSLVKFPEIDLDVWNVTNREDKKGYSFVTYKRK